MQLTVCSQIHALLEIFFSYRYPVYLNFVEMWGKTAFFSSTSL